MLISDHTLYLINYYAYVKREGESPIQKSLSLRQ